MPRLEDLHCDNWKEIILFFPKIRCVGNLLCTCKTIYHNIIASAPKVNATVQLNLNSCNQETYESCREVIFQKYQFYFVNVLLPNWFTDFELLKPYCNRVVCNSNVRIQTEMLEQLQEMVVGINSNLSISDFEYIRGIKKLIIKDTCIHGDLSILQQLEYLDIAGCDSLTAFSKTFPKLQYLNISYNILVTDETLRFFPNLLHLEAIQTPLTGTGLQHCTQVKTMDIRDCSVFSLLNLSFTPWLEELIMSGFLRKEVQFALLLRHRSLQHLKKLNISCCRITSAMYSILSQLSTLKFLDVKYSNVNDDCFVHLANITELNMNGVEGVSSDAFSYLQSIGSLSLESVSSYQPAHFWNIKNTLVCLNVCLSICVTSEAIRCLENLQFLYCDGCIQLDNSALENKLRLIELSMDQCPKFTTKCFRLIPQVKKIYFDLFCLESAAETTIDDFRVLHNIEELIVGDCSCSNITKNQLEELFGLDVML